MANRASSVPQLDLFVPALSDIQLRDQRETMERPFFSLSKRKRLTPINYVSPDGSVTVIVKPHQDYGMPTIWDADLLIWAASTLNDMKKRGLNDIPRRLTAKPYELLKAIGRDAGGSDCRHSCMTPPYVSATSPSRRTCARRPAKSRRTSPGSTR
jgi:plasmid replication initiation protein